MAEVTRATQVGALVVGLGDPSSRVTQAGLVVLGIVIPPASAAQSTATVPNGMAAVVTNITVQARDASSNPVAFGGAAVVVSITGANTDTPVVTDVGDGTYTCAYTPTVPGADSVAITLDGTVISGSPYTSTVHASATDSTATVPDGIVGAVTNIVVQAKDALGANVSVGGETVVVSVTGANTDTPVVTDVGDGTYTCAYTPTVPGADSVAITLDGTAISGSPYASAVISVGGVLDPSLIGIKLGVSPLSVIRI